MIVTRCDVYQASDAAEYAALKVDLDPSPGVVEWDDIALKGTVTYPGQEHIKVDGEWKLQP